MKSLLKQVVYLFLHFLLLAPINANLPAASAAPHFSNKSAPLEITKIYALLRDFRSKHNMAEIAYDARLERVAYQYINDIKGNKADNIELDQKNLLQRIRLVGYSFINAQALVISANNAQALTQKKWLVGKYAAILKNEKYKHVGIAYANTHKKQVDGVERHVWIFIIAEHNTPNMGDWKEELLFFVNEFRAEHKLPPLTLNKQLNNAAQFHSDDMAIRDYVSHYSPENKNHAQRTHYFGYQYSFVSENIGAGQHVPRDVVEGWKKSKSGHREAMIHPHITEAGIGYRYYPGDAGRATSTHYWAMLFAIPLKKK